MQRFDNRLDRIAQSNVFILSQIDGLNGQWIGGANLNPQALGRLKRSVLVTSAGASTRIEGANLSDEQIEKLMRGLQMQKMANRETQEVRGYYELLQTVFDSPNSIKFSENTIKQLHMELLKYVDKDKRHRGQYKKLDNRVEMKDAEGQILSTLFETTPPYLTANEMTELIDWTNDAIIQKRYHPLLIVSNFVVEFLKIHPFLDGNGRLSRIITSLLLLQFGYQYVPYVSHEKLIEDNKVDYYIALRKSQTTFRTNNETLEPWTSFFLNILHIQSQNAIKLLFGENIENLLSPIQLLVWRYIQTTNTTTTIREITLATGIARPTVRQSVERLLLLKKIERIGLGRATRYKIYNC